MTYNPHNTTLRKVLTRINCSVMAYQHCASRELLGKFKFVATPSYNINGKSVTRLFHLYRIINSMRIHLKCKLHQRIYFCRIIMFQLYMKNKLFFKYFSMRSWKYSHTWDLKAISLFNLFVYPSSNMLFFSNNLQFITRHNKSHDIVLTLIKVRSQKKLR